MSVETTADRSATPTPIVSVVVASYNGAQTISHTLASLAAQHSSIPFETIVVDSSEDDTPVLVARDFPAVRLVRSAERRYAGDARNLGAAVAQGRILAFLDADCTVGPDWIDQVVRAHARPEEVVGGVVVNGNPESYAGWAYYFTEFNQWLPDRPAGIVDEVPGCSMTIKRSAYDRYGPFMVGGYCSDTQLVWRLAAEGKRPYLSPSIRVAHRNPDRLLAILQHQPQHGRHFARLRSRERLTAAGTVWHAASAVFLPPVLFARAARRVWQHSPYRSRFILSAPLTFVAMTWWAWGELRGYLESAFTGTAPRRGES
ncbi:MAG: glycosyltransferase [Vicinamibacterales bacterium]